MSELIDSQGATAEDTVFEIRDATVRFGMDRGESRVLDSVDIDLKRNEILGVVGESGSGKSMFASAMMDAVVDPGVVSGELTYYPDEGDPVDVLDLSKRELKQFRWEEVSMVFQGAMSSFNPVRKINTHFVETLRAHDHNVSEGMERTRQLLADLYLDPDRVLDSYPHELSGGMQQRVLIALSLLLEPEVLVMDEPTAALDLLMQRSIISLIEELQEKYDLTIVFITHDLSLIANLADRLGVLYAFEFVEVGPAEEILRDGAHPYTRELLNSTPNLDAPIEEMQPIKGSSPDPVNIPDGCSYHPRCMLADERCEVDDPEAYSVNSDHHVHCHYWEESAEAIPMAYQQDSAGADLDSLSRTTPDRKSGDPLLTLDDVEVHFEQEGTSKLNPFEDRETVKAVDGVDLEIYENDVIVLVGESGSGKTTLGKAAIGIEEPTGGTVQYRGQDIWRARRRYGDIEIPYEEIRRSLQIIHQDPGSSLNSMRRVKALLEDPLNRWHPNLDPSERYELIESMLDRVDMTPSSDYIERYPHQLSGGEKQRVAMVRAMLMNPELIMADEPVSALDVSLRVETMDLMLELQDLFDTSYLFVSHDLSNARYIAEKMDGQIAIMYLGEIVEMGTPDEIIHDPKHPYTRALRWATTDLDPDAAEREETPIRSIDIPEPTNPPRGCRYHTRCSDVIPPEEYSFDQEEWNGVMNLKQAVQRGEFDYEAIVERQFGPDTAFEELGRAEFGSSLRDEFELPETLSDADDAVTTAIDQLYDGDVDGATSLLDEEFSTVCQRESPQTMLEEQVGERKVACFLESNRYGASGDD